MGRYIVTVTERKTREVVVDAANADEAKRRGVEQVKTQAK